MTDGGHTSDRLSGGLAYLLGSGTPELAPPPTGGECGGVHLVLTAGQNQNGFTIGDEYEAVGDRTHVAPQGRGGLGGRTRRFRQLTYLTRDAGHAVDAVLTERFETAEAVTETYRVRIRAGTTQESAAHTPGTTEHIIVLAGTARVGETSAPALIGPGMHGSWAADVPHLYQAPSGDVEALLIVRYSQ